MKLFSFSTSKFSTIPASVRGFTLVELMVTIAIFTSVMTIATGALFSAQAINTKLQETQTILDEVNLSIQILSRDIRYGGQFYCTDNQLDSSGVVPGARNSCAYPNGRVAILFKPTDILTGTTNSSKDRVAYFLTNGILYKTEYPFGGTSKTYQITSQDIRIDTLKFYVTGAGDITVDSDQPIITFIISGVTVPTRANIQPVRFSVQLSVSSRGLDD
jgi:prepilin-type N-terminal cleavage/methylation domain-containing protein